MFPFVLRVFVIAYWSNFTKAALKSLLMTRTSMSFQSWHLMIIFAHES